jgi:hypothetical protein
MAPFRGFLNSGFRRTKRRVFVMTKKSVGIGRMASDKLVTRRLFGLVSRSGGNGITTVLPMYKENHVPRIFALVSAE